MNRERAETYLRLLAEAETREPTEWLFPLGWADPFPAGQTCRKMQTVAEALMVVGALDAATAEAILADFDMAVSARQVHRGRRWAAGGISPPPGRALARRIRFIGPGRSSGGTRGTVATGGIGGTERTGGLQETGGSKGPDGADGPGRFVPLGLTIPFQHWGSSEGLYLMSYAHTAEGARFIVASRAHGRVNLNMTALASCTVTDDRGGGYQLHFTGTSSGPEWTAVMSLDPDPPGDLRWLDICPPRGTPVRVGLDSPPQPGAAGSDGAAAEVSQAGLGPGEHLLTLIAERLLFELRLSPRGFRQEPGSGRFDNLVAGLGEAVAALEAAEALAPDSPWLGRLVTLCANLGISDPELIAPPVPDLPEEWLSLLAHYLRRKADAAPYRDGVVAALAGPLPEVDGIRLALLGAHNAETTTFVHVLASGLPREVRLSPFEVDMYFPLSAWIRDDGGRWHLARADGLHRIGGEDILRLRLAPPLTRSTAWIEVLVAGRSARVRARLPFRWENLL
jgi:hypothetical protein